MRDEIKRLQDTHIRDLRDTIAQLEAENDQLTGRAGAAVGGAATPTRA